MNGRVGRGRKSHAGKGGAHCGRSIRGAIIMQVRGSGERSSRPGDNTTRDATKTPQHRAAVAMPPIRRRACRRWSIRNGRVQTNGGCRRGLCTRRRHPGGGYTQVPQDQGSQN